MKDSKILKILRISMILKKSVWILKKNFNFKFQIICLHNLQKTLCKTEIKFSQKFINFCEYVKCKCKLFLRSKIYSNKSIHHFPEYSNLLWNTFCNITSIVYHALTRRRRRKKRKKKYDGIRGSACFHNNRVKSCSCLTLPISF